MQNVFFKQTLHLTALSTFFTFASQKAPLYLALTSVPTVKYGGSSPAYQAEIEIKIKFKVSYYARDIFRYMQFCLTSVWRIKRQLDKKVHLPGRYF